MERKAIDKTLSAIVLIAYAVVWIIEFVVASTGSDMSSGFATGMSVVRSIMQIFVFIVLFYNAWQIRGGLIYRIIITIVTLWLIFCTVSVYIPGLETSARFLA